jgi:acetyl/propionyl-CoA carboxylase alpha subunit
MRTLLVANRGEIARRVIRTARAMGLRTVAVYSDPDRCAPHVGDADVAVALRGSSAAETYLDVDKILAAARATNADAIHPGYGFLSENAAFAEAVAAARLVFVGPSAETVRTMGDKERAKAAMAAAGVPVLPTYEASAPPSDIRYPLLVKATAGGGGKGMRLVDDAASLAAAIAAAEREAAASFGDGRVFLEPWVARPRHVEVQIFGDAHGNVIHLGERECSIQRRHQKVIEEAPSPGISEALRERMTAAALAGAKAIGYVGAGTFEFLVDGDEFFFLEVNTRLQVEHPVTEAVTGIDLVRLQLLVAGGAPLDVAQEKLSWSGHAIEVRLYAEDPAHDDLPSVGVIHQWRVDDGISLRYDTGVEAGSEVSAWYDPLLAKVIAHAPTRTEAAGRLARGLRGLRLHGVRTNRELLVAVLEHDEFLSGDTTTDFLDRNAALRAAQPPTGVVRLHAMGAVLAMATQRRRGASVLAFAPSGWRNVDNGPRRAVVRRGDDEPIEVDYRIGRDGVVTASVGGSEMSAVVVSASPDAIELELDTGVRYRLWTNISGARIWLNSADWQTEWSDVPLFGERSARTGGRGPTAPVPGTIINVFVAAGDQVEEGQTLVTLEAMKMEHRIAAVAPATVEEVLVAVGDRVDANQLLVVLA